MRKLAFLLILLITLSFLHAIDNEDVSLLMSFSPDEEITHHVEVGFSDEPVSASSITRGRLDSLSLEEEERAGAHVLSGSLHAFWDVRSTENFRIHMSAETLTDENGNELSFISSWVPHAKDEMVYLGDEGESEKELVYTHHPEISISHQGSTELSIETDNLEGSVPGVYRGSLILIVEDV